MAYVIKNSTCEFLSRAAWIPRTLHCHQIPSIFDSRNFSRIIFLNKRKKFIIYRSHQTHSKVKWSNFLLSRMFQCSNLFLIFFLFTVCCHQPPPSQKNVFSWNRLSKAFNKMFFLSTFHLMNITNATLIPKGNQLYLSDR